MASPDRSRAFRQWGLFGIACLVAIFVNGNGIDGVLHPLRIANLAMLPLIDEWKPSSLAVTPLFFAILAATIMLIVVQAAAAAPGALAAAWSLARARVVPGPPPGGAGDRQPR